MHNLHFVMVKGDSAEDAANNVESAINSWGNENNWRSIGGIASEDGTDDVENHDDARWGLSYLDDEENVPKDGNYFSKVSAYIRAMIMDKVSLQNLHGDYADIGSAVTALSEKLKQFKSENDAGDRRILFEVGADLKHLHQIANSKYLLAEGNVLPELYAWEFEELGFTDLSEEDSDEKRYIVFLDMHS